MSAERSDGPSRLAHFGAISLRALPAMFVTASSFVLAMMAWDARALWYEHPGVGAFLEHVRLSYLVVVGCMCSSTVVPLAMFAFERRRSREALVTAMEPRLHEPLRLSWSVTFLSPLGSLLSSTLMADASGLVITVRTVDGARTVLGMRREQIRAIETAAASSFAEWLLQGTFVLIILGERVVRVGTWDAEGLARELRAWLAGDAAP